MSSDPINKLPTDEYQPQPEEIALVNNLFQKQYSFVDNMFMTSKDVLTVGLLYILLALPQADTLILRVYPNAKNTEYSMIIIKCLLIMLAFFIIKNFYLIKMK